jgi:hypothetical protein
MPNSFKNIVKTGFGLGLGLFASQIIFILFGLLFFIPGFIMVSKARDSKQKGSSEQIGGLVLMGIGVVIMGGLGLGLFLGDLEDMF